MWKVVARARLEELEDEVKLAHRNPEGDALEHLAAAQRRLEEALTACEPDSGIVDRLAGVVEWYTGAAQERAWGAIHEADVLLTHVRSDEKVKAELPGLKHVIEERASKADKKELLDTLKKIKTNPPAHNAVDREAIASVKQLMYKLSDDGYEEKRSFRNIVIFLIAFVAAVVGLLAVPGWFGENVFRPLLKVEGSSSIPHLWQVELVGALAGLIVAIAALNKLAGLRGPYSLQFVQAGLKIPMGALTGLIGAVIVRSGELTIGPATKPVVFFTWVFVFGGAQQLITQFVDKKAKTVLEDAKPGA